MFLIHSLPIAIAFCVITMLGWGSWANTQKLANQEWRFRALSGTMLSGCFSSRW